jgi:hypothetical protein
MTKYIIEGNIDFFDELYNSLDEEENNNKTEEDNHLCLITKQPLIDRHVEMVCGHKFNYIPLYKDILNHKKKFNNLEGSGRLKQNEIRCPYCRNKQTGILPYYEDLGLEKVPGVNTIDPNFKSYYTKTIYNKCEFLIHNSLYDENGENPVEISEHNNDNCKFLKCFHYGSKISYYYGPKGVGNFGNFGDEKYYCWTHKKQMIKQYKKEISDKAKNDAKMIKLKLKEDSKKEKEEAKKLVMEEKKKMKEELKKAVMAAKSNKKQPKTSTENIILGPSLIVDSSDNEITGIGCCDILKSGINKGKLCGCSIFNDNLCKRHYNLKNKIIK